MILIIDNYDSFTFNLVQYIKENQIEVCVFKNDKISVERIKELKPDRIIISPGPGGPVNAGISNQVIQNLGSEIPILGVCLGHQCLAYSFGGNISRADRLMHGKTSFVFHQGSQLFIGVPNPFEATRYHSLIVKEPVPSALQITAMTSKNEIMGLQHKEYPIYGIQFHPESILTQFGKQILENFLD